MADGRSARRQVAGFMSEAIRIATVTSLPAWMSADFRDPHAEEGERGYIPTVDVLRLVCSNFEPDYIRQRANVEGYKQFGPTDQDSAFDDAVAVECACRELLAAQMWLLERL
jgi:hypothetical protein